MENNVQNDALRYREYASEYAAEAQGSVSSISVKTYVNGETTKLRAEVWYKVGTRRYPFSYFFRDLPTEADLKAIEGKKVLDLELQWGRMSENDEWGSPKIVTIILDGGEEVQLQGGKDEYEREEE